MKIINYLILLLLFLGCNRPDKNIETEEQRRERIIRRVDSIIKTTSLDSNRIELHSVGPITISYDTVYAPTLYQKVTKQTKNKWTYNGFRLIAGEGITIIQQGNNLIISTIPDTIKLQYDNYDQPYMPNITPVPFEFEMPHDIKPMLILDSAGTWKDTIIHTHTDTSVALTGTSIANSESVYYQYKEGGRIFWDTCQYRNRKNDTLNVFMLVADTSQHFERQGNYDQKIYWIKGKRIVKYDGCSKREIIFIDQNNNRQDQSTFRILEYYDK